MRIGVMILPAIGWREAQQCWRLVDELGFAHAWSYDHIAWRDLIGRPWYAAVPTLAAAAQCTRRIQLGTLVASPNFRHPVPFAKEALTLSEISGGRFVLGLGAGGSGVDAEVLGSPPWSPAERRERFVEFVEVVDQLLREPCTTYAGRFYSARRAWIDPAGGARARLPVMIAGSGPTGMRLAARHGDGWVTHGVAAQRGRVAPEATPETVRRQLDAVARICAEEGRDPATLRKLVLNVNRTHSPLASVGAFTETVERYARIGVTDLIVPFPRSEAPYQGNVRVLEQIAADVLPALTED
ncbi:LLM class flavin-dependent oxidoreductase [Micromonospora sp. C28ISP2-4]|uniref:LLM class flavin-dependent oxidoreductase n=1 Tax=Micromonospora TaxID=1873 RepID=UPI002676A53D|nr:LLM class flavin-dependent oxidoreductase [Micromonospora sp. C28ISP2-4]MDO3685981.1 LLM class flavin-dependent oxidoreductase [Micromonospora sp. C28ISP2-4]